MEFCSGIRGETIVRIERGASNLQSTGLVEQVIRERNWFEMDIIGPKNDMNC